MALDKLEYTKDWKDTLDFPTVEESEEQVRADMQYLFDEIAEYINDNLVDDGSGTGPMSATQIPFKSDVAALSQTTILTAIEYLYDQISEITEQYVADHSVTNAKLSRESDEGGAAVDTDNIIDEAVDLTTKVTGLLPTANGGLGVDVSTTAGKASARTALGIGDAAQFNIVPMTHGGLGTEINTTSGKQTARNNLGLGALATANTVSVANGGTGASTVAAARNNLGLGNTSGAVPVANGGTGGSTAATARANLNAQEQVVVVTTAAVSVTSSGVSVPCSGVTSSNNVFVTYHPDYFDAWQNGNVRCTGQGTNTITLKSDSTVTVKANVIIFT